MTQGRRDDGWARAPLEEGGGATASEAVRPDAGGIDARLPEDGLGDGHELAAPHLLAQVRRSEQRLVLPGPEQGEAVDRIPLGVEGGSQLPDVRGPVGELGLAPPDLALGAGSTEALAEREPRDGGEGAQSVQPQAYGGEEGPRRVVDRGRRRRGGGLALEQAVRLGPEQQEVRALGAEDHVPDLPLLGVVEAQARARQDLHVAGDPVARPLLAGIGQSGDVGRPRAPVARRGARGANLRQLVREDRACAAPPHTPGPSEAFP